MNTMPPAAAVAADAPRAGEAYPDRPVLVRWAHVCTFAGFFVWGLSVVGIVLAVMAVKRGEHGATTARRNAIAVTVFLAVCFLLVVIIASSL